MVGDQNLQVIQQKDLPQRQDVQALRRLAFVGLQERWAGAVCLFHAILGAAPRAVEFTLAHARRKDARASYNESLLEGFEDADDELVYQEAVRVFDARMRVHAPACVGHADHTVDA